MRLENETPGEKRLRRDAETCAREHLDRQTNGRRLPFVLRHDFALGHPLQKKAAPAMESRA
jgi:hypothetical protein